MKQNKQKAKKTAARNGGRGRGIVTALIVLIALVIVIAGVFVFAANAVVINSAKDYIITPENAATLDADCILVLGCKANGDQPSDMLSHRLMTGIELYRAGAAPKLLMSGDHGTESYDEVYAMKKFALADGIDTDDVFCDHAGFSTYDSMYRAKEIFGCKKIVVVTQEYHLSRAVYIGRKLGMEVYGVACDRGVYAKAAANARREAFARVKAVVDCIFKPEPEYLGEAIPISGKGSVTDDKPFFNESDEMT